MMIMLVSCCHVLNMHLRLAVCFDHGQCFPNELVAPFGTIDQINLQYVRHTILLFNLTSIC